MTRVDKLGRRIPEFDRSAANKKAAATRKEKYGANIHSRIGSMGARIGTRGYFGKLKDEGKIDELKALSQKGIENRKRARNRTDATDGDDSQ